MHALIPFQHAQSKLTMECQKKISDGGKDMGTLKQFSADVAEK